MTGPRRERLPAGAARATARAISWLPLALAGGVAFGLSQLDAPGPIELRLAAVALCTGAAFVLDDPAGEALDASPTPRLRRRALRIALVLPLIGLLWSGVLLGAEHSVTSALTVELATMLAVTLAAAAAAAPLVPDGRGGLAAAPVLLGVLIAAALVLPERWTLFAAGPGDPRWQDSHARWGVMLAAGAGVLVAASRDRARRPPLPPTPATLLRALERERAVRDDGARRRRERRR